MNTNELYDAFRSDVVDTARPYLWSDVEAYRYMADAHRMFVRLTGGIADFTSDACSVTCPANERDVTLHPSVLRVLSAERQSDSMPVKVINFTDMPVITEVDYGRQRQIYNDTTPGPIKYLLIGKQRGIARVVHVPTEEETLLMSIYRMPLLVADGPDKEIVEVDEEHHIHLLDWMEHMAYKKQDAETFNRAKSDEKGAAFQSYCDQVKREWERYKHKTRVVRYGGI